MSVTIVWEEDVRETLYARRIDTPGSDQDRAAPYTYLLERCGAAEEGELIESSMLFIAPAGVIEGRGAFIARNYEMHS